MKKIKFISKAKKVIVIVLIFLISSFFLSFYPPFTKLNRVKTTHFIIYYQDNVKHLVNEEFFQDMENMYNYLSALVNYNFKNKIYVYFSNTEKIANGFANPMGHMTIYVITTPPELTSSIGNYGSWLHYVFFHELTHIFSLALKDPFTEFLSGIFGNIFIFNMFNNPEYMVEGITVSLEGKAFEFSKKGNIKEYNRNNKHNMKSNKKKYGRLNDPLIKQYIVQNIIDGKFKTPQQTISQKQWPENSSFYWYGGYFSYFLQEKYGMKKYIALWHATLKVSFKKAIKVVYNKNLSELWDEFYNYMIPDFDIYNSFIDVIKPIKSSYFFDGKMVVVDEYVYYYYYNYSDKSIYRYNFRYKKNEMVLSDISSYSSFDISGDNKFLLLSYYDRKGSNPILNHKVYIICESKISEHNNSEDNDKNKSKMDENDNIKGIKKVKLKTLFNIKNSNSFRELTFFNINNNSGRFLFLGIDISHSTTDLILVDKNGKKKDLLKGAMNFYISSPKKLDFNTIIFIGSYNGLRGIYRYKIGENKKLYFIKTFSKNIRDLNILNGKIFFTYNNDFTFTKFGMIEDNHEINYNKNYSGGFFSPYYYKGYIYYIGRFSEGSRLLKLKIDLTKKGLSYYKKIRNDNKNKPLDKYKELKWIEIKKVKSISIDTDKINKPVKKGHLKSKQFKDKNYDNHSKIIFPFNENILPVFWFPAANISFNEDFSQVLYGGSGACLVFFSNVTNDFNLIGIYLNGFNPLTVSWDYILSLNLFNPFKLFLMMGNYSRYDINSDNKKLNKLFYLNTYVEYMKQFFPSYDSLLISLGINYTDDNSKRLLGASINIDYLIRRYVPVKYNMDFINLLYYSNYENMDNFKIELAQRAKFKNYYIFVENNFVYSYNKVLSFYGINEYYNESLYEPLYELYQIEGDKNFSFLDVLKLNLIVFEIDNIKTFLNIFYDIGMYIGTKFCIYGDVNNDNLFSLKIGSIFNQYKYFLFYYIRFRFGLIKNLVYLNIYISYDDKFEKIYFNIITDYNYKY